MYKGPVYITADRICMGDHLYDSRQNMYRGPVCMTADRLCTGDQFVLQLAVVIQTGKSWEVIHTITGRITTRDQSVLCPTE